MTGDDLAKYIDQRRWLLNCGLITDDIKNNLFMYGSIVHSEVCAVQVTLDVAAKRIGYTLYCADELLRKISLYDKLSKSQSLWGLWRFRRLLRKEGSLDFRPMLTRCVNDLLGPSWSTSVQTRRMVEYKPGPEDGEQQSANNLAPV